MDANQQLRNAVKKNIPYGFCKVQVRSKITRCMSDLDITLVCFPFDNKTIFQFIESQGNTLSVLNAMNSLSNYLINKNASQ